MSDHGKTNEWNTSGKVKKHLASVSDLAAAWHGSKDGIAWHREHGKKTWETREKIQKKCEECGVAYSSYWKRSRHCGANCYARYYRRERMK
jgi:protein-arginine kinase activator protein McsA